MATQNTVTHNAATQPFRVEFKFNQAPPINLVKKEYERLDELKTEGTFVSLDLKPDKSGGILEMRGQSKDDVQKAIETLPLYPYADWHVYDENQAQ